jgi:hypothetical protein
MHPRLVMVLEVARQNPPQVSLVERDHVVPKMRSRRRRRGLFIERWRTSSWWREARFSVASLALSRSSARRTRTIMRSKHVSQSGCLENDWSSISTSPEASNRKCLCGKVYGISGRHTLCTRCAVSHSAQTDHTAATSIVTTLSASSKPLASPHKEHGSRPRGKFSGVPDAAVRTSPGAPATRWPARA